MELIPSMEVTALLYYWDPVIDCGRSSEKRSCKIYLEACLPEMASTGTPSKMSKEMSRCGAADLLIIMVLESFSCR